MRLTLLLSLTLFSFHAHSESLYKWVDENGTTHYSSKPVSQHGEDEKVPKPDIPMQGVGSSHKPEANGDNEGNVKDQEQAQKKKDETFCKQVSENITVLKSGSNVEVKKEDGSLEMLDNEQKKAELKRQTAQFKEACS